MYEITSPLSPLKISLKKSRTVVNLLDERRRVMNSCNGSEYSLTASVETKNLDTDYESDL